MTYYLYMNLLKGLYNTLFYMQCNANKYHYTDI